MNIMIVQTLNLLEVKFRNKTRPHIILLNLLTLRSSQFFKPHPPHPSLFFTSSYIFLFQKPGDKQPKLPETSQSLASSTIISMHIASFIPFLLARPLLVN